MAKGLLKLPVLGARRVLTPEAQGRVTRKSRAPSHDKREPKVGHEGPVSSHLMGEIAGSSLFLPK